MSKTIAALAALFVVAVLLSGCGKSAQQTVYMGKEGKVTATRTGPNAGKVEFEGKEGKATIETNAKKTVSEAELGVPVYPNVDVVSSSKMETNGEKIEQYALSTTDSFEKVEGFYKSNLKNVMNSFSGSSGEGQSATFMVGSAKNPINIIIARNKSDDKTTIAVIKKVK